MDKRTFGAFALIFAILMIFPYLNQKFFPGEPRPADPDTPTAVVSEPPLEDTVGQLDLERLPADDSPFNEIETPETAGAPLTVEAALRVPTGPESLVEVVTPLYRIQISSVGGRIVSWEGLEHKSWTGGVVQLIPETIPDTGLDALVFRTGEMPLGEANYTFGQPTGLHLQAGDGLHSLELSFRTDGGLMVRKIFTIDPATYAIGVDMVLGSSNAGLSRQTLNLLGSPEGFRLGWNQGIATTERVQKMEAPSLRTVALVGDGFEKKKQQNLKKDVEKVTGVYNGTVRFAGVQNRYFTVFGVVPQATGAVLGTIRLGGDQATDCQSWSVEVPALRGQNDDIATAGFDLFIGPQVKDLLLAVDPVLEQAMDLGYNWIRPLTELVVWSMAWMHQYIPNYGVIIILLSILQKLAFYPLSKKQTESMKRMQEIQPKLKAMQAKYKDDKEKLNQATMKLYKEEKVNPVSGCLPMLLQLPVFMALYQGFSHTVALRQQPFVLWIKDLAQPDALFQMPFELPMLGGDFNVLPILMSVAMYFQTKLTPSAGGGQMAAMNTMMPLIMVFIFYNMPSGLVLYWLVNTIMQAWQSYRMKTKTATPTTAGAE